MVVAVLATQTTTRTMQTTRATRSGLLAAASDRADPDELRGLLDDVARQAAAGSPADVEQLPYDEVACRLAVNLNTAKSRVARGRALVASRLVDCR
jgi:DNA-directed RNA polymerase specialized sigma24 family protein